MCCTPLSQTRTPNQLTRWQWTWPLQQEALEVQVEGGRTPPMCTCRPQPCCCSGGSPAATWTSHAGGDPSECVADDIESKVLQEAGYGLQVWWRQA
jgi:hypothetical protein